MNILTSGSRKRLLSISVDLLTDAVSFHCISDTKMFALKINASFRALCP